MTHGQSDALLASFGRFMHAARTLTQLDDRSIAEWLLSLSARWLHAHGYTPLALHQWMQHAIEKPAPAPLTAAGRARKDFGERR